MTTNTSLVLSLRARLVASTQHLLSPASQYLVIYLSNELQQWHSAGILIQGSQCIDKIGTITLIDKARSNGICCYVCSNSSCCLPTCQSLIRNSLQSFVHGPISPLLPNATPSRGRAGIGLPLQKTVQNERPGVTLMTLGSSGSPQGHFKVDLRICVSMSITLRHPRWNLRHPRPRSRLSLLASSFSCSCFSLQWI